MFIFGKMSDDFERNAEIYGLQENKQTKKCDLLS